MGEIDKALRDLLYRIGMEAANEAKKVAPVKTRNLKNDIGVFTDSFDGLSIEVGNTAIAPYAKYVYYGTGIYGYKKERIKPKRYKALNTPYGYRKSIKGQKPNPYLKIGLDNYIRSGGLKRALKDNPLDEAIVKELGLEKLKKWS